MTTNQFYLKNPKRFTALACFGFLLFQALVRPDKSNIPSLLTAALTPETEEFSLTLEATPDSHQQIELSNDLSEWRALITVTMGTDGIQTFRALKTSRSGRLFYRAVQVEVNPQLSVNSVEWSGDEGAYWFSVEISSEDTGCEQYADWWEVLKPDGRLIYRRILTHSHVDEQPFTRSGGPMSVNEEEVVIVRAHMFPSGYGPTILKGSVLDGFVREDSDSIFAGSLVLEGTLPRGCGF